MSVTDIGWDAGVDGLREYAHARARTVQRFALPLPLNTFRRTARIDAMLGVLVRTLHGRH